MADQIKVNDAAWKALSKEHQDEIHDIVSQSFGNVSIVGDPAAAAPQSGADAFKLPGGFCKILCDLAAQAGHIACGRLPAPARPICNAGVDAAAKLCKNKCK
jgi:hypothetical protein